LSYCFLVASSHYLLVLPCALFVALHNCHLIASRTHRLVALHVHHLVALHATSLPCCFLCFATSLLRHTTSHTCHIVVLHTHHFVASHATSLPCYLIASFALPHYLITCLIPSPCYFIMLLLRFIALPCCLIM
jgi:hypothetical protein